MEQKEIVQTLTKVLKTSTVLENEPMKNHTTFRIGGNADIYIKLKSKEDLKEIIQLTKNYHIPLTILGNGSNVLVTDKGIRGIVLETDIRGLEIIEEKEKTQLTVRGRRKFNSTCYKMQREKSYWSGICLWNSTVPLVEPFV